MNVLCVSVFFCFFCFFKDPPLDSTKHDLKLSFLLSIQSKKFCDFVDKQTGYQTKCMLTFPLMAEKECLGVVMALNKIGANAFTAEDEKVRMHTFKHVHSLLSTVIY